jgi:hypothetical protein
VGFHFALPFPHVCTEDLSFSCCLCFGLSFNICGSSFDLKSADLVGLFFTVSLAELIFFLEVLAVHKEE